MHTEIQVTRKINPNFKYIHSLLCDNGQKRTHTVLLGEKLILSWLNAQKECFNRFEPLIWLRLNNTAPHQLEQLLTKKTIILNDILMKELADANSPPEHALIVKIGPEPSGALANRIIVPWGIQNPGNLGAMLRSAAAFGFQEAILGPQCADPFNKKAVRGSMGAIFLMPARRIDLNLNRLIESNGFWFALDSNPNSIPINEVVFREPLRILVGNEGHGWQGSKLPHNVQRVTINTNNVESLNAAVAAGIMCFEISRRMGL
jgi:TrmH family RNA methyltransferase